MTVVVQDNGGVANGGVDQATNTFTILVTPVNDAPVVASPIPKQAGTYGTGFSFAFAANTFSDVP